MPTYGKKKVKDMIKSVLPSTARKGDRDNKNAIHREHRRTERQSVKELVKDPDLYEETYVPSDKDYDHRISYNVKDRRHHDKVGPLERWAPKVTKGKHDKRRAQLRKLVPKGTIGSHAIGHVLHLDQFTNPNDPWMMRFYLRKPRKYVDEFDQIRDWLTDMMRERPYLHGPMNAAIKYSHYTTKVPDGKKKDKLGHEYTVYKLVGPRRPRLLKGINDIEQFVQDIKYARWGRQSDPGSAHPEWFNALQAFIKKNPSVSI